MEKRKPLSTVGGNVNWFSHYGEEYRGPPRKLKIELLYNLAVATLGINPKEINTLSKRYVDACVTAALHDSQNVSINE